MASSAIPTGNEKGRDHASTPDSTTLARQAGKQASTQLASSAGRGWLFKGKRSNGAMEHWSTGARRGLAGSRCADVHMCRCLRSRCLSRCQVRLPFWDTHPSTLPTWSGWHLTLQEVSTGGRDSSRRQRLTGPCLHVRAAGPSQPRRRRGLTTDCTTSVRSLSLPSALGIWDSRDLASLAFRPGPCSCHRLLLLLHEQVRDERDNARRQSADVAGAAAAQTTPRRFQRHQHHQVDRVRHGHQCQQCPSRTCHPPCQDHGRRPVVTTKVSYESIRGVLRRHVPRPAPSELQLLRLQPQRGTRYTQSQSSDQSRTAQSRIVVAGVAIAGLCFAASHRGGLV